MKSIIVLMFLLVAVSSSYASDCVKCNDKRLSLKARCTATYDEILKTRKNIDDLEIQLKFAKGKMRILHRMKVVPKSCIKRDRNVVYDEDILKAVCGEIGQQKQAIINKIKATKKALRKLNGKSDHCLYMLHFRYLMIR